MRAACTSPHPNPPPQAGEGARRAAARITLPCLRGREGPAPQAREGGGYAAVLTRLAMNERSPWGARFWLGFAAVALALIVLVPVLNRALPPGSPLAIPDYLVPLLGKYLCFAMLALSLDLVWGYAGILSLGHGAFFALGGYAMGMYLMRQIGTRGVYQNPVLPDFMVFLNWQELPWFWWGFDHFA